MPSLRALPPKLTFLPGSPEKTLERTGRNIIRNPPQQRRAGGGAAPSARGAPPAHRPRGSGDQGLGRSKPPALGAGTGPRRAAVPSSGLRPEAAAQTGRLPGGAGRGRRGAGARRRARRGRLRGRSPGVTSAPGARGPRGAERAGFAERRPPARGRAPTGCARAPPPLTRMALSCSVTRLCFLRPNRLPMAPGPPPPRQRPQPHALAAAVVRTRPATAAARSQAPQNAIRAARAGSNPLPPRPMRRWHEYTDGGACNVPNDIFHVHSQNVPTCADED